MRLALLAAIAALSLPLDVSAHPGPPPYCPMYTGQSANAHWESGATYIPVYVSHAPEGCPGPSCPEECPGPECELPRMDFLHDDFTVVTDTELFYSMGILLNEFHDRTDMNRHLKFMGSTELDEIPGAILIRPSTVNPSIAYPADTDQPYDNEIDRCTVLLWYIGFSEAPALHELGHCIGLDHPHACGLHEPGLMGRDQADPPWQDSAQVFREYDIEGLEWAYGQRTSTPRGWSINSTGSSWTSITSFMPFELTRGPLSACNSLARDGDQVLFTGDLSNRPQRWDTSVSYAVYVPESESWTPGAIACNGTGGYMAAYIDQKPGTDTARHRAYVHNGTSGSTLSPDPLISWDQVSDQLRGTYDPATGKYVLVYHRDVNESGPAIDVQVVTGGTKRLWANGANIRSRGTPNIACGPPSVVGTENCLVAWADGGWDPTITWVQGHVNPTTLEFEYSTANIVGQGMYVWGGPAIAYTGNATSPWLLVIHQGTQYLFAYKKGPGVTDAWVGTGGTSLGGVIRYSAPTILSYRILTCGASCFYTNYFRVYTKTFVVP